MATRPKFSNTPYASPILDVALSGTTHDLTAGELAALTVNGQLVLDVEYLFTADQYAQSGWFFDLTTSVGSIALGWVGSGNPAYTLGVNGSTAIFATVTVANDNAGSSVATAIAGQRMRVIFTYTPGVGALSLQFVVNGMCTTHIVKAASTALGTVTAVRLGSKADGTLVIGASLSRLRAHHYVAANQATLVEQLYAGNSIESFILQGDGVAPASLIYSAAEAAAMVQPKGQVIAVPGQTIAQQKAVFEASYQASSGVVKAAVDISGINDAAAGGRTGAQMIADKQAFITSFHAKLPAAKFLVGSITPGRTYSGMGDTRWANVVTYNGALGTLGADGTFTSHYAALDDGTGALLPVANSGDSIHPLNGVAGDPTHPGRVSIAAAESTLLSSLGLR